LIGHCGRPRFGEKIFNDVESERLLRRPANVASVPIADGDQNRELPFAGNAQNGKTDIRYAFS